MSIQAWDASGELADLLETPKLDDIFEAASALATVHDDASAIEEHELRSALEAVKNDTAHP